MKPRVLFVGRTRYRLPLSPTLARKWDALAERLDVRVLASAAPGSATGDGRFALVPPARPALLDGPLFYAALPVRVARELRRFRPAAVIAQSPYDAVAAIVARRLARRRARIVLDVHGDWRSATRLYGGPLRPILAPLADRLAAAGVRGADEVRTISDFTSGLVRGLGVEPSAVFPAFVDLSVFRERPPQPLPARPRLLFVGVLERYKNVDGLVAAWRLAAARVPGARLVLVGRGRLAPLVERLVAEVPGQTEWRTELPQEEIADALDASTALVLPSRSEGLPRIVMEAFCRGRPVVGTRAGGIPDLVVDGVNGLLVEPGDTAALAEAMVRVLADAELAARLAEGATAGAADGRWIQTAEEFAERMRALVET